MSDNESQAMKIMRQSANATVAIIVAIIAGVIYFNMPDRRWFQLMIQMIKITKNATKLVGSLVKRVVKEIGIYRTMSIIIAVVSGFFLIINAWALSVTLSVWWYTIGGLITMFGYGLALLLASLTLLQFRAIAASGIQEVCHSVTQTARKTARNVALSAHTSLTEQS